MTEALCAVVEAMTVEAVPSESAARALRREVAIGFFMGVMLIGQKREGVKHY